MSKNRDGLIKKVILISAKSMLALWGIFSWMQGAGLSFFMNGERASEDVYLNLTYGVLGFAAVLGFLSSAIASVLLLLTTAVALKIVFVTHGFRHNSVIQNSLVSAVVWRPGLGCVILGFAAVWERRWFSVDMSRLRTVFGRRPSSSGPSRVSHE